ncbi:MAG: DUF4190 domain-containing protein [Clostridia bacterium]|nr:DUF4190 domain-containing protein [Clostridia bacterium]
MTDNEQFDPFRSGEEEQPRGGQAPNPDTGYGSFGRGAQGEEPPHSEDGRGQTQGSFYGPEYFGGAYQPWGGAPTPAPVPPKTNGFAIASLSCGIASLVICCAFSGAISLVLGILGIVFAGVSRRGEPMTGMAKAGMICGIVALVFSVIAILLSTVFYAALEELIGEMENGYGEYAARVLSQFKGWLK